MWVIMAAPLMLGCDIRNLTDNALSYLTNADLVAVNQDPWGLLGSLHQLTDNGEQIYVKPLSDGSFAFTNHPHIHHPGDQQWRCNSDGTHALRRTAGLRKFLADGRAGCRQRKHRGASLRPD